MRFVLVNTTDVALLVDFDSGDTQMLCSGQLMVYDDNIDSLSNPVKEMISQGLFIHEEVSEEYFIETKTCHNWRIEGF